MCDRRASSRETGRNMSVKQEVLQLLERRNYSALLDLKKSKRGLAALLISLTYDKRELLCWKAIEAVGLLVAGIAGTSPQEARSLVQRILWMMREESGNNAWSGPEMLGEIVRNCPEEFSDIAPIIASFHDEEIFRPGVMRALLRIAETRPDLAQPATPLLGVHLRDANAAVRLYAVLLAGRLKLREHAPEIEDLRADRAEITIYDDGVLRKVSLGKIAAETVILLSAKGE